MLQGAEVHEVERKVIAPPFRAGWARQKRPESPGDGRTAGPSARTEVLGRDGNLEDFSNHRGPSTPDRKRRDPPLRMTAGCCIRRKAKGEERIAILLTA